MEGTGGGSVFSCYLVIIFAGLVALSVASQPQPKEFDADIGDDISLPCKVDDKHCGQLHSVKWYKDSNRVYVMRSAGKSRPEGDATNRMAVHYSNTSGSAVLQINPVEADDEATYKCEITYLEVIENCDVVQIVKLKTLKKPESVKVHSGNGVPIANGTRIGPKVEGDDVTLICEASGGKPIPQVKWYNNTQEVQRAVYTAEDMGGGIGTGKSVLDLKLTRGDLLAKFECRVESPALRELMTSWIDIDIHGQNYGKDTKYRQDGRL